MLRCLYASVALMSEQYKPFGLSTLVSEQTTILHFTKMFQCWPQNTLSCLTNTHTHIKDWHIAVMTSNNKSLLG